jgi:hypothetical protein
MSRPRAVILAVFTVCPLLYFILLTCMFFVMAMCEFDGGPHISEPQILMVAIPLHFFTIFETFVLLVIYTVHLFKTDRVPQDKKALWAVVLVLGHAIAMPIYWYLYIWKDTSAPTQP